LRAAAAAKRQKIGGKRRLTKFTRLLPPIHQGKPRCVGILVGIAATMINKYQ
jgi:hypothetical protein